MKKILGLILCLALTFAWIMLFAFFVYQRGNRKPRIIEYWAVDASGKSSSTNRVTNYLKAPWGVKEVWFSKCTFGEATNNTEKIVSATVSTNLIDACEPRNTSSLGYGKPYDNETILTVAPNQILRGLRFTLPVTVKMGENSRLENCRFLAPTKFEDSNEYREAIGCVFLFDYEKEGSRVTTPMAGGISTVFCYLIAGGSNWKEEMESEAYLADARKDIYSLWPKEVSQNNWEIFEFNRAFRRVTDAHFVLFGRDDI